ncbi:hypothetical protein HY388_00265 [Candidatus Daviesbacteria bacterium]|nr:hypothetical protein [Candidatus Daviesbacteria bacterium]
MPSDEVAISRREALGKLAAVAASTIAATKGLDVIGSAVPDANQNRVKELLGQAEVFYPATVNEVAILRKDPTVPDRNTGPNEIARYQQSDRRRFLAVEVPAKKPIARENDWFYVMEIGGDGKQGFVLGIELKIDPGQRLTFKKP